MKNKKRKKNTQPSSAIEVHNNNLIENVGRPVGKIDVEISYHIIELFSAGLYSSPNKAFEELVSNAYDANAKKVCVNVPPDLSTENATLWVCDNGESMNSDGLRQLWKIGSSNKRDDERRKARLQIGRFGIGKLATYVLASKLTYICKNNNKYLAVTMDYSKIDKGTGADNKIKLDERELKLEEVQQLLNPMINISSQPLLSFNLWGTGAEKSWTMVIMSLLKPKAKEITEGRLQWVLKTALPINPDFSLFYNGSALLPSKIKNKIIKTWEFGKNDDTAKKFKEYKISKFKGKDVINFEHLKNVSGRFELFDDSLLTGKSEKLGRSHGIFLMVRGRLINADDPLLGMDAFSHGAFNRSRIIVNADGLDDYITSTRESIKDSSALNELREYIKRKFNNEIRVFWLGKEDKKEREKNASFKVSVSPGSLTRRPLLILAKKYFNGDISEPLLTKIPNNLDRVAKQRFLAALEKDSTSEIGIIKNIIWGALQTEDSLAVFDMASRTITVNLLHPFLANFSDDFKDPLPLQLIAVTEILTEAHMIELGISQEDVRTTLYRRDQTLRELTYSDRPNAPAVAMMLRDSIADPTGFESAIFAAFSNLGFETTKIGGKGQPDGKSVAYLGYSLDKQKKDYTLLYEAKSTTNEKISAATAKISASVRHRADHKADYSVTIARDFDGAEDPKSAISKEAVMNKVTLIRTKDLMKLVLLSSPKQIGLHDLKNLFETCFTVLQTSEWIDEITSRKIEEGPIDELLETVYRLQKVDNEPAELAAIRREHDSLKTMSKEQIKNLVLSLVRLVPGFISLEGEIVSLNCPPKKIKEALQQITDNIPAEFREVYLKAFE